MTTSIPVGELAAYADVVLRCGVDIAEGQKLLLIGRLDHQDLISALAERAYAQGAGVAHAVYLDDRVWNAQAAGAPSYELATELAPWHREMWDRVANENWAVIMTCGGPTLPAPEGADPRRAVDLRLAFHALRRSAWLSSANAFSVCAAPSPHWAEAVYGEPDEARLWRDLRVMLRLDEPDPVAAWTAHVEALAARCRQLDAAGFVAIHFEGGGTDLRVPLHPWAAWGSALMRGRSGRQMIINIPTEEVAATPDFRGVEGVAVATRPTSIDARPVEGLVLRFEAGRIVEVQADANADAVRAQIATDAGACHLGEVALVDGSSGLARLGRVFYDQLIDENAACHIAWGNSYPEPKEMGTERDPADCEARGVNLSAVHQDMMIGGPLVQALGVTADGEETPIILHDQWQL